MPHNYGQGRVYQRPGSRNLHIDGKEYRESARNPKRSVVNGLLIKQLAEVQSGIWVPNKNIHVGQLLDLFLADYERNGKSLDWATIVVGHLRPFFGSMPARQLGTNAIETYVEKRRQAGRRNSTINRELSALRRSFRLGKDRRPPLVAVIPRIEHLKEPPARRGFFEFEMFTKLRAELPEYLRSLITFAYNTGVRKGEILLIRCEQVDVMEGIVRLEPGQTKNGRAAPRPARRKTL